MLQNNEVYSSSYVEHHLKEIERKALHETDVCEVKYA